jgi:hypothetical protein
VPALVLGGGEHHSASQMAAGHSHGAEEAEAGEEGHEHGGEQLAQADTADGHGGEGHPHGSDGGEGASGSEAAEGSSSGGGHAHGARAHGGEAELDSESVSAPEGGHDHGGGTGTGGGGTGGGDMGGGHDHGSGGGEGGSAPRSDEQAGGHDHGAGEKRDSSDDKKHDHAGGKEKGGSGGGDGHQHGDQKEGGHQDGHGGHGGSGGDHGDGHGGGSGGGHGGEGPDGGMPDGDDPGSLQWGAHRFDYEPARPGQNGQPGRGYAFVYRGPPDPNQGTVGHHSHEPCQPTPEQQAAADRLYRETEAVVRKYDNSPQRAIADGFTYAFPITDRITHMVSPKRVQSPTILAADQVESFLYVMTDRGLMAIAGMYVMPDPDTPGPQFGGCLTRWHRHSGLAGLAVSAGTTDRTPEMLHIWTYPGLDPYAHYDGRTLSRLWGPGSAIPSLCRETGDSSDVCLP